MKVYTYAECVYIIRSKGLAGMKEDENKCFACHFWINADHEFVKMMVQAKMREYLGDEMEWNEEWMEPIVDYLRDNHGRGLVLYGSIGVGKTFMATKVIKDIFGDVHERTISDFPADEMVKHADEMKVKLLKIIDDVGVEIRPGCYDDNHLSFFGILDYAMRKKQLLIITTNLLPEGNGIAEGFNNIYGPHAVDRLKTFYIIGCSGKSKRPFPPPLT